MMPSIGDRMIVFARFTFCWLRFASAWPSDASDDLSDASADFTATSRRVEVRLRRQVLREQLLGPLQLHPRVFHADLALLEVGLALHQRRVGLLDLRVDRVGVDPQQDLALLDERVEVDGDAVLAQFLDDAAHLRTDLDGRHRVERAGGADHFGDVAAADLRGRHLRFGAGAGVVVRPDAAGNRRDDYEGDDRLFHSSLRLVDADALSGPPLPACAGNRPAPSGSSESPAVRCSGRP